MITTNYSRRIKGPVLMSNGEGGCRSAETAGQQTEAGQD